MMATDCFFFPTNNPKPKGSLIIDLKKPQLFGKSKQNMAET